MAESICADQPDSSWPSVSGIASIRWVRPVLTTLASDFAAPVDGRLQVFQGRPQLFLPDQRRRHLDRGGDHVVRTLAEVDMVVGVHGRLAARDRPRWRSPRWRSCCWTCPSRSGRGRSGTRRRTCRRRSPRPRPGSPRRRSAGSRPRSALDWAATALISPRARRNSRGMRSVEIGKFCTARWVWAPYSASAGTRSSPKLSCSRRVLLAIAGSWVASDDHSAGQPSAGANV